jgi:hypothetical protein
MESITMSFKSEDEVMEDLDISNYNSIAQEFLFEGNANQSTSATIAPPIQPDNELFDVNRAIREVVGPLSFVPRQYTLLQEFTLDQLKGLRKVMNVVKVRYESRDPTMIARITPEQLYNIGILLSALHSLDRDIRVRYVTHSMYLLLLMVSRYEKEINAKGILSTIADPVNNFPSNIQKIAKVILDLRESQNWGKPPSDEQPLSPLISGSRGRIQSIAQTTHGSNGQSGNTSSPRLVPAPASNDHPIFGLNGFMHHMRMIPGKPQSICIDPHYMRIKKSASVFGANGFSIGDCWPSQLVALRDGVHGMYLLIRPPFPGVADPDYQLGQRMAGISGSQEGGAWSIVVSGLYDDVDQDSGEELWYSAPNGNESVNSTTVTRTAGENLLLRSIQTGNPVRVLRSERAKWFGRPAKGYRYDGLYQILRLAQKANRNGGVYTGFELKRLTGQMPIDTTKPTPHQVQQFELAKYGY